MYEAPPLAPRQPPSAARPPRPFTIKGDANKADAFICTGTSRAGQLRMLRRVIRRATSTGLPFAHDLPPGPPHEREGFILDLCAEKRVIHLGFVDEHQLEAKRERAGGSTSGSAKSRLT